MTHNGFESRVSLFELCNIWTKLRIFHIRPSTILKCRSEDVDSLKTVLIAKIYLSYDIIDEQIEIMADHVLQDLLTFICSANYYSVIGDKTRDVSGKEQFAILIR